MKRRPLLVTIDVECDKGPDWRTASPLSFVGVDVGIGQRLHPLCTTLGIRPTYLLSPEVLCHPASVQMLRTLDDCELGTHLHGEYVAPALPSLHFAGVRTDDMQCEYDAGVERDKLATLTELFRQQIGRAPRSFRAGRFGIGPGTGAHLLELGYLCDSSITPLVQWTSQHGERQPDFRTARNDSWFVSSDGDLMAAGNSALLEIPVTIRGDTDNATWFRPWYSSREQMIELIDAVAAEADAPLCMMFHNVELLAAASPYPQTDAEVQRYLDDFGAAMAYAQSLGFVPMTMAEAQSSAVAERLVSGCNMHPVLERSLSQRDRSVHLSPAAVLRATQRNGTQAWHAYSHQNRAERWDLTEPYSWLADRIASDGPLLDVGCGIASNLIYMAEQGLSNLMGFDFDATAIASMHELQSLHDTPPRVWVDNGLNPDGIPDQKFAAITSVNWTFLVAEFSLPRFFDTYVPLLQNNGYLVLDAIDASFDQHPKNNWLSSDWNKPEHERRPSEYKHRYSRQDIVQAASVHGLQVVCEFRREEVIPRSVYILQRPKQTSVLLVVDAKGWAHDHKSRNLASHLPQRYDCRIVYQQDLVASDLAGSDLIVIWYWRQLESLAGLGAAIAQNRHKLLMGVCSHNELEGDLREAGLSILQRLPAHVFTHSKLLESAVRGLLPDHAAFCLPNGVDTSFFKPAETTAPPRNNQPLRIGWAGSLDNFGADMRGVSTILEPAVQLLNASHPGQFELLLAAREDRMRTPTQMRDFYQGLDVYVCASRVEGTPNPGLEAAACGIPVVSTRVGNMPELIQHGVNGLLIDRNVHAMAAALLFLQQHPETRSQMGRRLRKTTEREWSWRHRATGFTEMFDQALTTCSAPSVTPTPQVVG
ncbi:MAG: glycosyltransferase involved in cell wall biosynthesis [Planctomycetota bacterium]|jgi:glycosyltransferase involved in cell wall biosynthesis